MRVTDFDIYTELLRERSGLVLNQEKSSLLESRLTPVARKWGYIGISEMTDVLQGVPPVDLVHDIVEAMSNNDTCFFRDTRPFEIFRDFVLPSFKRMHGREKKLRIWSAGCSSGQEAYSLAMLIRDNLGTMPGWVFEIVATDICHEILEKAKDGCYSTTEVQYGLPVRYVLRFFTQENDKWRISSEMKNLVKYQYFNLLENASRLGQFDVVFCANVLQAMGQNSRRKVLENLARQMGRDAFLFIGAQENTEGVESYFKPILHHKNVYTRA